jgi:hypothetical protein
MKKRQTDGNKVGVSFHILMRVLEYMITNKLQASKQM